MLGLFPYALPPSPMLLSLNINFLNFFQVSLELSCDVMSLPWYMNRSVARLLLCPKAPPGLSSYPIKCLNVILLIMLCLIILYHSNCIFAHVLEHLPGRRSVFVLIV